MCHSMTSDVIKPSFRGKKHNKVADVREGDKKHAQMSNHDQVHKHLCRKTEEMMYLFICQSMQKSKRKIRAHH